MTRELSIKEIQKLCKHKIPTEREEQKLLQADVLTGAELGSLLFLDVLRTTIRGGKWTSAFQDFFYKKCELLTENEKNAVNTWIDYSNYIQSVYRIIGYQNTICYLGIGKVVDTITTLFNINITDKNITELIHIFPKQRLQHILDAGAFILGWNCFLDITCDFFGIQEKIKNEMSIKEVTNLFKSLNKRRPIIQNALTGFNWEKLKQDAGEKIVEDIQLCFKYLLEISELEPPTTEAIKEFTNSFFEAISTGSTLHRFYECNETMFSMFYRGVPKDE